MSFACLALQLATLLSIQHMQLCSAEILGLYCAEAAARDLGELKNVSLLFIASSGGELDTNGTVPAVLLAAELVNREPSVLPGRRLSVTTASHECTPRGALDTLFSNIESQTVAIIGAGCLPGTEALGKIVHYFNLSMISYSSSSMKLDDRANFPSVFHTTPSEALLVPGITAFVLNFKWRQVVIITQDEQQYFEISSSLEAALKAKDVNITGNILFRANDNLTNVEFFLNDAHIYVLNMHSDYARYIICQAKERGLDSYATNYVWILRGGYEERWWQRQPISSDNCSAEAVEEFLHSERAVVVSHVAGISERGSSDVATAIIPTNYAAVYKAINNDTCEHSNFAAYAYDAVWAVALALNRSLEQLKEEEIAAEESGEEMGSMSGNTMARIREMVQLNLERVQFEGVSGKVKFENTTGNRVSNKLFVLQYRKETVEDYNNSCVILGEMAIITLNTTSSDYLNFTYTFSHANLWLANSTPPDGTPIKTNNFPSLALTSACYLFALVLITSSVACIVFTVVFRKRRMIRITSPNLNYIIGFGVIWFNIAVFFFVYPEITLNEFSVYCNIRPWFASIGYSLCFGTINAKMWRVYYIFHKPKVSRRKEILQDWPLFCAVMIFVLVDIVILSIAAAFESLRFHPESLDDKENDDIINEDGVRIDYVVTLCTSQYRLFWLVPLLGYKLIVQGIGVYLAFRIRKVKIKVLNDSREISITLYISSIILVTVLVITVAFSRYLNVYGAAYSFGIMTSSAVVLCVVFVSKMVRLYRDPSGESIFATTALTTDGGRTTALTTGTDDDGRMVDNRVAMLERRVKELQTRLSHYDNGELSVVTTNSMVDGPMRSVHLDVVSEDTPPETEQNNGIVRGGECKGDGEGEEGGGGGGENM